MSSDVLVITSQGHPARLSVVGEIDLGTRQQFEEALARVFGTDGDTHLDLQGVPFMDTHSVTAIVQCAHRLSGEGGRLIVQNPPESLIRIYTMLWAGHDGAGLFIEGLEGQP